jgi:CheY-like chemotaxis protein
MGSRILLADDSITIQKVVNLTFADEGIEVVAVSNGDTAERRLAEVNPDLVLADIFMPGKNGYELCESIKKSAQFRNVPVVLLVGAFEPFDQAEARRVQADAHLTKPFESRTLVETVRKLISVSARPGTGPVAAAPSPAERVEQPREAQDASEVPPPAYEPDSPVMIDADLQSPDYDTLNESAPLDFEYTPEDAPPFLGGQSDHATPFNGSPSWKRRTDELSFSSDQVPFQSLGHDDISLEAADSFAPVSVAVEPDFTVNAPGAGVPSRFANTQDTLLDFDRSVQVEERPDYDEVAFDVDSRDPLDVDASQLHVEAESEFQTGEPHSLDTTLLEMPPNYAISEQVDTNPLEMPSASDDASFGLADQGGASVDPSSLLTVDEPLGDVLIDEGGHEIFSPEQAQPLEQPLDPALGSEAFSLEFTPHEEDEPAAATGKMTATATADLEAPVGELESAHGQTAGAEPASSGWQPIASEEVERVVSFEVISAQAEEAAQPESAGDARPAPRPGLDSASAFESAEQAEPFAERDGGNSVDEPALDSKFGAYSMWSDEETRFAPIDIEATSLDEPVGAKVEDEASQPEKGFEFMQVASDANAASPEPAQPEATPAEEPAAPVSDSQANAIELSPALIDDIVRRVVAQMSDAAVREIAWEVVPDCVERVIKEMTRQELPKRA